jgi:HK97 family phage prohead protease
MADLRHKDAWIVKDASLGERQIRVVASDGTLDRAGDIMVPEGCLVDQYRLNPIVLAQHDPGSPIGNAKIKFRNSRIEALIDFAPAGISKKADEYCGLAKAGIINAVSIGFDPVEKEPLRAGWRYTKWELLEISLVSVPANSAATIIERSAIERSAPAEKFHAFHAALAAAGSAFEHHRGRGLYIKNPTEAQRRECSREAKRIIREIDKMQASVRARLEYEDSTPLKVRIADWQKRREAEIRAAALDLLTPEQQSEVRQREVAERFDESDRPMGRPFKWDPYADQAENAFQLKKWEANGGRAA